MEAETSAVHHNLQDHRFEIVLNGHLAVLEYRRIGKVITYYHTGVPAELEGQGIGSRLTKAALDYARAEALHVIPTCWFVSGYIQRHPEYADLV